jgi:tetratricopeptide (TPR) repeat protein
MNRFTRGILTVLGVLLAGGAALADTIESKGLAFKDVKITKIEGNEIYFTTSSGTETHHPVNDSMRINIVSEPVLNAAESSFATQKWDDAAAGYQKVLASSPKDWIKDYAAIRLQLASEKAKRFDAAVSAWIYLVGKNPKASAKFKPALPEDPGSAFIKTAESELDTAAASTTGDVRQALLGFEMDMARFQKDDALVLHLTQQLVNSGNLSPAATLNLVKTYLDAHNYTDAQKLLDSLKGSTPLPDPAQEDERLFDLAEVVYFTLPANAAPAVYQDLALDYMRVVANNAASPLAPLALLRVGDLHEKFKDTATALQIYRQISANYDKSPQQKNVVDKALQNIHRLEGN